MWKDLRQNYNRLFFMRQPSANGVWRQRCKSLEMIGVQENGVVQAVACKRTVVTDLQSDIILTEIVKAAHHACQRRRRFTRSAFADEEQTLVLARNQAGM